MSEVDSVSARFGSTKGIKIAATVLTFVAIALQIWQLFAPLPNILQAAADVALIVLAVHAIEGLISAALILRYRLSGDATVSPNALLMQKLPESTPLAVLKAGLYAFFVGTVGLTEVIEATKKTAAT